jgi:hypothetical protein
MERRKERGMTVRECTKEELFYIIERLTWLDKSVLNTALCEVEYNRVKKKLDEAEKWSKVAFNEIDYVPTADVVEVVRCKDCKHIASTEYGGLCCLKNIGVAYNDYCSYGERSENGKS